MSELALCEMCGGAREVDKPYCSEECVARAAQSDADHEALIASIAVAPDDPDRVAMPYADARAAVERYLDRSIECDDAERIEGTTWWYVPHVWIGCSGFVVDKTNAAVFQLGSAGGHHIWLWAYNRGMRSELCDLHITRVLDRERTLAFLRHLGRRIPVNPGAQNDLPPAEERDRLLDELPAALGSVRLWPSLDALWEAERRGWFEFRIVSDGSRRAAP